LLVDAAITKCHYVCTRNRSVWHILIAIVCCAQGSLGERITSFFVGGAPRLRVEEVIYSPGDRFRLQTVSGGVVHVQLGKL